MERITEQDSHYNHLETLTTAELLAGMNTEDKSVPLAVEKALPAVAALVEAALPRLKAGGRLFYTGAGTSGRLGVLDASECPPTFGVPPGMVVGIIAGGDTALRNPVEYAEDNRTQGWLDLHAHRADEGDVVVGLSASGTAPYVLGAVEEARRRGLVTGCITCNPGSPLAAAVEFPVEVIVGPEFLTGSSRLKAGTAQKLILNMITTSLMIRLGRVKGNKMVDMQLSNHKLVERGSRMVMAETGLDEPQARALLLQHGSVRKAIEAWMG